MKRREELGPDLLQELCCGPRDPPASQPQLLLQKHKSSISPCLQAKQQGAVGHPTPGREEARGGESQVPIQTLALRNSRVLVLAKVSVGLGAPHL